MVSPRHQWGLLLSFFAFKGTAIIIQDSSFAMEKVAFQARTAHWPRSRPTAALFMRWRAFVASSYSRAFFVMMLVRR